MIMLFLSKKVDKLSQLGGRYMHMQNHFFLEITNSEHIDSLIVVSKFFSLLQITPLFIYSIVPPPFHLYPFWFLSHNHSHQIMQTGSYHSFLFHLIQSEPTGGKM